MIKNYLIIFSLFLSASCTNITQSSTSSLSTTDPSLIATASSSTVYTHVLKNVSLAASSASSSSGIANLEISLSTDPSLANYQPLTGFCGLAATNACLCQLQWTEINTSNGVSSSYQRTKKIPITIAPESARVKCQIPQSGQGSWDEIANATVITMNIIPAGSNGSGLNVKSINFKKGTTVGASGDFLDDTLTPFRNIHRYSCYTKTATAYEINNQYATSTATDSSGNSASSNLILGSRFCSSATSISGDGKCANPRSGFSAQSYYRNFYIPSDKMGEINSTNNTFDCPKVVESIRYSAGQSIPAAESGQYYPLDATFSLATSYSADWNVGVRAASILLKTGDVNENSDACTNEDLTKRLSHEVGTVTKCLGYAKKPNVTGTCSSIKDSNGRIRPLTRLRRYRVIYPPQFKANGDIQTSAPLADEVYVADRLVVDASGVATGNMIYGPKPCNFSWFDHEGVTNRTGTSPFYSNFPGDAPTQYATPKYVSTSSYAYASTANPGVTYSVNPDGLIFPNTDRAGDVANANRYPSCSATLPVIEHSLGVPSSLRLLTTHSSRKDKITLGTRNLQLSELHIQPIDPWTPNYLEDTSFQACVPLADPYLEPPLHFYLKDSNTMGWCSEPYPTQNPYWYQLNKQIKPQSGSSAITANLVNWASGTPAPVNGFTSHETNSAIALDAYNACTGTNAAALIAMTTGTTNGVSVSDAMTYLSAKSSTKTCDRTVSFDSNQAFFGFPLQASDSDIQTMLQSDLNADKTFSCQYSVNADVSKIGARMPASGCCGMVNGNAVLKSVISGGAGSSGHLEPLLNSLSPTVRFCGSPVE